MKKYLILAPILFLGCMNKVEDKDRLYLKEIKANNKKIEWFYYSTVSSTSADYVLLNDSINSKSDTIVNSTNVKDVSFSNNEITLFFYGKPKVYEDPIKIKSHIGGFNIKIDTTAIFTGYKRRESYLKK
jgi:hypothetical protein